MPRIARIVGTGYPHHIIERGNNREKVFKDSKDYEKYLFFLSKYSEEKKTAVLAYCLMPNHIHLLLKPSEEEALAKTTWASWPRSLGFAENFKPPILISMLKKGSPYGKTKFLTY